MNKEMLRQFKRTQVENKCEIIEDFLSKSLVYNQKKRMSLEEVFSHAICYVDLSKFKLLEENNRQKENINTRQSPKKKILIQPLSNDKNILFANTVQTNNRDL